MSQNNHLKNLCILFGGRSGEHEVSLLSAASVIRHAPWDSSAIILVGIDRDGRWWLQSKDKINSVRSGSALDISRGSQVFAKPADGLWAESDSTLQKLPIDVVFPVLHGTNGEDGTVQGFLETADLPYVGSGILGSALGMDKEKVKRVWIEAGVPVVPFSLIRSSDKRDPEKLYAEVSHRYGPLVFVKPSRCGSSVGISRADSPASFVAALELAFNFDDKVMIEPAIDAREIEVSVIGNNHPQSFTPGEILPSHAFYDYDAKYLDPEGARLDIPASLTLEQCAEAKRIAEAAYLACEARGFSRVDLFLERKSGKFMLNEINTIPGFTNISMFPMLAAHDGLAYNDLIIKLCTLGKEDHEAKHRLRYSLTKEASATTN